MPEYELRPPRREAGRKRRRMLVGSAATAVALLLAACGTSSSSPTTTGATPSTTRTSRPSGTTAVVSASSRGSLGVVLTDGENGPTLYRYTPDGTGKATCTGACATAWPPLTVPAGTTTVAAGAGVPAADLGTVTRPDGTLQVAYRGMPLYRYAGDSQPTQTNGQGVGGIWFVVNPAGPPGTPTTATSTSRVSGY